MHSPSLIRACLNFQAGRALSKVLPALVFIWSAGCSSESSQPVVPESPEPSASAPSSGRPSDSGVNHPPVIRTVNLLPSPVMPGEPVKALVEADDPDSDPVTFRHQWLLNGEPIAGEVRSTLLSTMLKRGDQLMVEVIPSDGKVEGVPVRSHPVIVPNSPPQLIRLTMEPGEPHIGDRVKIEIESKDQDGDAITYAFRWFRNNVPIEGGRGDQASLDTAGFARGDVILVEVTPFDGMDKGRVFRSPPLTIGNSHPTITSQPSGALTNGRFEYAVIASDLEGDPLTYALETAPPGMTINKATGLVEWQVSPGIKGRHRIRIAVRDDHDGYGFQEFEVDLGATS